MKIDLVSMQLKSDIPATQIVRAGSLDDRTDLLLKATSKKVSKFFGNNNNTMCYAGAYTLNDNDLFTQFNNLTIDGKAQAGDNADEKKILNNTFFLSTFLGANNSTLYNTYHLKTDFARSVGFYNDEVFELMLGLVPYSIWNNGGVHGQPRRQLLPLRALLYASANEEVVVNNRADTIATGNEVQEGMYLTLLRKFDTNDNIELENIYTEAQSGQVAFGKVEKVFGYKSEDGKVAKVWMSYVEPFVVQ